ncbi:MAG: hypothetical protein U0166_10785 [Acidobacteriota bacterium]
MSRKDSKWLVSVLAALLLLPLGRLALADEKSDSEKEKKDKEAAVLGLVDEEEKAMAQPLPPPKKKDPFGGGGASTGDCGPSCRTIAELDLIGIVTSKDGRDTFAILKAADDRTYNLRAGATLKDGTVKSITADRVVFAARVVDPHEKASTREIVKKLEPLAR